MAKRYNWYIYGDRSDCLGSIESSDGAWVSATAHLAELDALAARCDARGEQIKIHEARAKALESDRDQISLTLDVAKADRDKWFNRAKALEAALRDLVPYAEFLAGANYQCEVIKNARDLLTAPETVVDEEGIVHPRTETKGESNDG